ncbi:MAG TPA: EamA family transporter [Kribbellaceae bacterium]|nr:EamA family transporter [Kribbellaceae bacterium]
MRALRSSTLPAPLLVLGGVVSVQFGGALAATLIPGIGAGGAVTLRLGLGAVVLLLVARPRLRGRDWRDWRAAVGFGLTLGLMNLSFYLALARLPLGVAVTVEFIGPLGLAAVLSRRARDLVAVAVAAAGVVLVNGRDLHAVNWTGVGFGLLAGACWASYILLSAETGRRFGQLDGLALAMVVGTAVVAPYGIATAGGTLVEPHNLLTGAAVAVLSSVLPYSLELLALRRIRPVVFGILMSLEPAVGALAGFSVLGQRLSVLQIGGMACVVAASIAVTRSRGTEQLDL